MSVSSSDTHTPETTSLDEEKSANVQVDVQALPDASDLEDKMPLWFRSSWLLVLFVVIGGLLFFYFSSLPVGQTNIWGDMSYGRMIWETKSVPTTEQFMPLSAGMEMTDNSWLSQLGLYQLFKWKGLTTLQFYRGACLAIVIGLFIGLTIFRCKQVVCTLVGLLFFLWLGWTPLHFVEPQLIGLCCFMVLWGLLQSRQWKIGHYVGLFLLFVLWVNLHASFALGLVVIALCCVGRLIDLLRRTDGIRASFSGNRFRRYLSILELALLATLLNPYGLRIYSGIAALVQSENMQDISSWGAVTLRSSQGQAIAFVSLILMIVYRMTPRRISTTEILQLVALGAAGLWMRHLTIWWAIVAAYYFVVHTSAIWNKAEQKKQTIAPEPRERKSLWTVTAIGLAFIFWGLTPFGHTLLHGRNTNLDNKVSSQTPYLAVTKILQDRSEGKLPPGQMFHAHEWGDFILWMSGNRPLPVFTSSNAHLIPQEVWQHYNQLAGMGGDWRALLDLYGVNVVLIDMQTHSNMADALGSRTDEWQLIHKDNIARLFYRIKPL